MVFLFFLNPDEHKCLIIIRWFIIQLHIIEGGTLSWNAFSVQSILPIDAINVEGCE